MNIRCKTRPINLKKKVQIGGQNKVIIQSMCNTKTRDVKATVAQIKQLEEAGCEIVRVAVLNEEDARAIKDIVENINIPLVADIHFNPDYAIMAIKNGVNKIRLNPGNIKNEEKIKEIVNLCKEYKIPIRIGINAGSLDSKYEHKIENMIESAKDHIKILESLDFYDICLSFKSSDVLETIDVYRLASKTFNYPLHLGVTEAGPLLDSSIKSSVALGTLLLEGIGDTIRISISDDPVKEIKVAKKLLKTVGLRNDVPDLVSCPTCGRIQYEMLPIVEEVSKYLEKVNKNIKVAVMGCPVNGPLEAKRADIGICGGKEGGILIKNGEIIKRVKQEEIVEELIKEIDKM